MVIFISNPGVLNIVKLPIDISYSGFDLIRTIILTNDYRDEKNLKNCLSRPDARGRIDQMNGILWCFLEFRSIMIVHVVLMIIGASKQFAASCILTRYNY